MCSEPFGSVSAASEGAPLGIYAKSHTALIRINDLGSVDPETGEVVSGAPDDVSKLLERYALQSVARELLPHSRTAKCLRVSYKPGGSVELLHSPAHQSASYGGLVTCSSVWACPVCAAKVSERRRVELFAAIKAWESQGGSVVMLTLTHPHTRDDPLETLLDAETAALKRFMGCRQGCKLMAALGRVGHVRAWEVTHGRKREINNGWHPHFHILLFLERPHCSLHEFEDWAYAVWSRACRASGLDEPNRRYGVSLQDGSRAAEYVAKMGLEDARGWGLDAEMTKGHIKRAKNGETPFDLLRAELADGDAQARALFREYAAAFKGKRQLVWSRGLRELLGLGQVATDAELAAAQEDDCIQLSEIGRDQWRQILRCDARAELLVIARRGDYQAVMRFIEAL